MNKTKTIEKHFFFGQGKKYTTIIFFISFVCVQRNFVVNINDQIDIID